MPRKVHHALSPLQVKNLAAGKNVKRYADGGGLYLQVKPGGARSWIYRATFASKVRYVGLGSAAGPDAITLAKARDLARVKASEVAAGVAPVSDRKKRQLESSAAQRGALIASTSFRDMALSFIGLNEAGWKNDKHRQQWRNSLEAYAYPHFGDLPVAEVATEHVTAALKPIWMEKPETANRVRGRIENILDAAKVEGLREGENPARWRGHLDKVLPNVAKAKKRRNARLGKLGHHAAMPYADVPAFAEQLAKCDGISAWALEFTILTAARSGEVYGATWHEVDLAGAVWTIPAERMKADAEHTVPLSARAVDILRKVQPLTKGKAGKPLFPATHGGALSSMAMAMQLRRLAEGITVHGFRSSFRDWAAESTGFSHEVCEMALAHTIGNKAEAAYRRGQLFDKRRKLMDAWSTYCGSGGSNTGQNVTPIRGQTAG